MLFHDGPVAQEQRLVSEIKSMMATKIRHDWFQSDTHVTLSLYMKQVKREDVTVMIQPSCLSVTISLAASSEYHLELDPLFDDIQPDGSSWDVLSTQVQIRLAKKSIGLKWLALEGSESVGPGISMEQVEHSVTAHTYPSSSKKKADW
jgi:suppressor of G2 allele of SKP1